MRTGCGLAALVIVMGACGSSAAAPTGSNPATARPALASCGPSTARTLAVDGRARVYVAAGTVYGCATGSGHAVQLGQGPTFRSGQPRVGRLALAGVTAGYALGHMGVDTFSTELVVRRLDTGQVLHDVSATTGTLGPEFFQSVEAIVIKPDGAVAWIADGGSIVRYTHHVEVVRIDRRGQAVIDTGPGILPTSLRLSGSRLIWQNHGAKRSADLL